MIDSFIVKLSAKFLAENKYKRGGGGMRGVAARIQKLVFLPGLLRVLSLHTSSSFQFARKGVNNLQIDVAWCPRSENPNLRHSSLLNEQLTD
jgi:hypothetical protein